MSSQELSPSDILNIAKISQYLAANSISSGNNFKGNAVIEDLADMIFCVREGIQVRFSQNINDPTLQTTCNYLYDLLGRFGLLARARLASLAVLPPVITGPNNVTVNAGQNATFSTSVSSSVPYTVQWYDHNNTPIPGATTTSYTFLNAQPADSGVQTFYMKATNSAGVTTSPIAVLVVNSIITGQYYFGDTDYSAQLLAGTDNVPYVGSFTIANGQPFVVPFPVAAANNRFIYVKYPSSQPTKTVWVNTQLNSGTIPDQAYQNQPDGSVPTIGTSKYIISRGQITQDSTQPTVTYS